MMRATNNSTTITFFTASIREEVFVRVLFFLSSFDVLYQTFVNVICVKHEAC